MPKNGKTHEPGLGHNDVPEIGYRDLRLLPDGLADKKQEISEASGRYRAALKEVIESREWNKTALAAVIEIDAKTETARADFLRSFDMLYRVMSEGKWDAERRDLLDAAEEGDVPGDDEDPFGRQIEAL